MDWTQKRSIDGHLSYIYVNGSIMGDTNILRRFSVVNTSDGEYSLRIYNIHPFYSGWYDCYETDGRRIIGYYVVAAGMFFSRFDRKYELNYTNLQDMSPVAGKLLEPNSCLGHNFSLTLRLLAYRL